MSFPSDFYEYQMWKNTFDTTPERWVQWRKMEDAYDDHQDNLLKYEVGLDLVELITHLLKQGPVDDSLLGEAVRRAYDWKALGAVDDEPE